MFTVLLIADYTEVTYNNPWYCLILRNLYIVSNTQVFPEVQIKPLLKNNNSNAIIIF